MHNAPLVSIICLCYNHERFLSEALDSVIGQTYPNIEIIVVDDVSTDGSVDIIQQYLQANPQIKFISTGYNRGNCAAFNMGWRSCSGDFVIDFATDDVLLPDRVEKQIAAFAQLDSSYGVVYTNAAYINDNSEFIDFHYKQNKDGRLISFAPSGYIFKELLQQYIICPPTMMMRRQVFEFLDGYDETLAYEDFDFWIRSSKKYQYFYLDQVTTKRRVHASSLSRSLYGKGNRLLASTVKVCEKAADLVQTVEERRALARRLKYEARHAYLTDNFQEAKDFLLLLKDRVGLGVLYRFLFFLSKHRISLSFVRQYYYRIRYNR